MKTVLIIGSNGVLGADLVQNLQQSYEVIPVNRDNYDQMKGTACDVLINANGNSKRFWANEHPLEDFEASTTSVYKSLLHFSYKKYIYISSSDVYVDHTNKQTTDDDQPVASQALSPYGFHKFLSETLVQKYAKNYLILRSCLMLGTSLRKGPIYDLLHDKPLFISLDSQIQMITTQEISSIMDFMIQNDISNSIFNMGGEGVVDFSEMEKYFDKKPQVLPEAQKQVYEMNIAKLKKIYPIKSSQEYLRGYIEQIR